ncbi:MAG: type II secretion system F family protein [Terracidiphilus sp.]|jgi:tight adherence protein C|nr:type II secretion system F family protein [Terracidiphilus sp.]
MGFAISVFLIVFLLIASGGLLLFYRETMLQRITEVINPQPKPKTLLSTIQQTGLSISGVVEHFENVLPKSQAEISVVKQRLIRAGYRQENAIKIFYGSKVLVPLLLCMVVLVSGLGSMGGIFVYIAALGLGFLMPDFWLGRRITTRQHRIRRGLPDVLDLLIICIEAGLSLDQATARSAEELRKAQPELSDELTVVVLEQRAGRPRSDTWKHLADRTGVDAVRNLVSMLVQSEQFGTSIAKTLRVHSDTLRTQRVQRVEEMAAKSTIKLIFPLVLFIFPALFVVLMGPAVIIILQSFKTSFGGH